MFTTLRASLLFAVLVSVSCANTIKCPTCPANEHPTDCVNPCPTPTCSDLSPASCNFLVCNKGCECDEGYVRTKKPDGACVPISQCKPCSRPDFAHASCGNNCTKSCKGVRGVCPLVCVPGCYCAGGKVLDETTNKCVESSQCKN